MGTGAAEPLVAVRADGDPAAGLGHVRRCLALAAELAPSCRVRFLLRGSAEVADFVRQEGFPCDLVPADFEATLAAAGAVRAAGLVVDSYDVRDQDYGAARSRVPLLVVLDDFGHASLSADLVVDPAPVAGPPRGRNGGRYLLGPRYALLRREFAAPVRREVRRRVGRVLLILGGATPAPLTGTLARAARRALPDAQLDVVVGPAGDAPSVVAAELDGVCGVTIHHSPESIRPLMLESDLAVTGGGVTVFELAATGTPGVGVEIAPNQAPNLAGMAQAGALVAAGRASDGNLGAAVEKALARLAANPEERERMSRRGRELVDGRGAARVAEAIRLRLMEQRSESEPTVCAG